MSDTLAYVYKWTHIPTLKWYIGSRTAVRCNPDDGYLCSSKRIKPLILTNKNEWKREILATGSPEDMLKFEGEILQIFDARNDPRSFNGHNNDGDYKILSGDKNPMKDPKVAEKNHLKQKGQKRPSILGDNHPNKRPEIAEKIRNSHLGKDHPWMLGEKNVMKRSEVVKKLSGNNHWVNKEENRKNCEHCGIVNISKSNYTRWHSNNCKLKKE
jgi:hypothetical protein